MIEFKLLVDCELTVVTAAITYPNSNPIAIPQLLRNGEPKSSMITMVDSTRKPNPKYSEDPHGRPESPT